MLIALLALQALAAVPNADPFEFFQPSVTVTVDDRRQLDRGEPIARVLPGQDLEIAVFAAVHVDIDGDRLVAWMRRIEELKKSSYVLAIGRFRIRHGLRIWPDCKRSSGGSGGDWKAGSHKRLK